jgi:hypothetical protein
MATSIDPTQISMYASLNLAYGSKSTNPSSSIVPATGSYGGTTAPHFDLVDGRSNPQLTIGIDALNIDPEIEMDLLDFPSVGVNSVIIDNHNLETAHVKGNDAKVMRVEVEYGSSKLMHLDTAYEGNRSGSLSAATMASSKVSFKEDGFSVMNATGSGLVQKEWLLDFDRSNSQVYTENALIGEIGMCHRFDTPFNPDVNTWNESIEYDGVNVQEAIGGNQFATELHKSRRIFSMTWSRLLLAQRQEFEDFFDLLGGQKWPFWISFNSDSTTPRFYKVRLISDTVKFSEKAPRAYELRFAVKEELG